MAKNYIQEGKTIAITATAAIGSGELVQIGDMFAVAITDIADGGGSLSGGAKHMVL